MKRFFLALALLAWTSFAVAQVGMPWPGPGGKAGNPVITTPVTLGASVSSAAARSSWTLTTTNAIPAGALAIVCVQAPFAAAQTITSISDGTNSYTAAVTNAWDASTQLTVACWIKENAAAVSSSATITANFSAATIAASSIINAGYVIGTLSSSSLDKTNSGITSAGTAYASGTTGTLTQANEIAFGFVAMYNANASVTEGAGFTAINTVALGSGNFDQSRFAYQIVAATTALNYQPSASLATFGKALIMTIKGF